MKVMKANGFDVPSFKWFMANNAQANWNVVCIVFGPLGNLSQPLRNREKTCLFHSINPSKFTPIGLFNCHICGQNTWKSTTIVRIPKCLMKEM